MLSEMNLDSIGGRYWVQGNMRRFEKKRSRNIVSYNDGNVYVGPIRGKDISCLDIT